MENVMTKSFEDRFFEMIEDRFKRQDERADKQDIILNGILEQTRKTNGRVTTLEKLKSRRLNIPTNVLVLIATGAVVALLIVAKLMGVNVGVI